MRHLLWILFVVGCASEPGSGTVVGSLLIPHCEGNTGRDYSCADASTCEAFRLDVDFLSMERFESRAVIRLQEGGQPLAFSDGLSIDIPDVDRVVLGVPIPVVARRPAGTSAQINDTDLRIALSVRGRCPQSHQSFSVVGSLVFDAFGTHTGDRVAGAFDALTVRDGRAPQTQLGTLRGTFDFTVRAGGTHQRFIDP